MLRVTDVVKHLLVINVLLLIGTYFAWEPTPEAMHELVNGFSHDFWEWKRYTLALFYPTSEYFRPFQVITHMFMHGDPTHLLFNMFALYIFGPPLEIFWGARRFLFYYLATGVGAFILQLLVTYIELEYGMVSPNVVNVPMLGASGAIFGLLAGYGMLFPNNLLHLLFPPITLKAKYFVLIYAGIELLMGLSPFNTGVAHFAHLGGALAGFLLIIYWRKFGTRL
jgi:membrane associated rhomboid family serine protease